MLFVGRSAPGLISNRNRSNYSRSHTLGQTFIVGTCLCMFVGMTMIIFGVINDTRTATFIGIGVVTAAIFFLIATLVYFYAKLENCYNNWAYRSRIVPMTIEIPHAEPQTTIRSKAAGPTDLATIYQKRDSQIFQLPPTPLTAASELDVHRLFSSSLTVVQ